jgi:DNA ligase-1
MDPEQYQATRYQKDSKGRVKVWKISVVKVAGDEAHACIVVESGLLTGKLATNLTVIEQGKNVGKANETTPWEQAVAEAKSKTEKKEKEGYVVDVDNVQESHILGSGTEEPMLAQKYHPQGLLRNSKGLDKMKIRGKRVGVQRKKDGNRANPTIGPDGKLVGYLSRKGNPYPYHFPQITEVLERNYQAHPELRGQKVVLDGELYTKDLTFDELNGILKKKTLTPAHIAMLQNVEFHLYDIYSDEHYERRIELFTPFADPLVLSDAPLTPEQLEAIEEGATEASVRDTRRVKPIETIIVEAQEEILDTLLQQFLAEGEEGAMIRALDAPYRHKRTWDLTKYKVTETEDFRIKRFELDKRGILGKIYMYALPGMRDRKGNPIDEFKVGTKQNREILKAMLENQADYIGEMAVVEFGNYTQYGVPRFGKFKGRRADYTEPTEED